MKIGIIADVHGNYQALKAVIDDMKSKGMDSVIVLGDIIFKGDEPLKCFNAVKELNPICWILGNTDDWFNEIDEDFTPSSELEERILKMFNSVKETLPEDVIEYIRNLKEKEILNIEEKSILCVHGSDRKISEGIGVMTPQEDILDLIKRMDQDILLCAHTHSPYIVAYENKLIMNVGSVGLPNDEPRASYGFLDFDGDEFEYGIRRVKIE